MRIGAGVSQKQTAGMVPEHLLGKSVLKMSLQELQGFVQAELNENPALTMEDDRLCPVCGSVLYGPVCTACDCQAAPDEAPDPEEFDHWQDDQFSASEIDDEEYPEPFAAVATPTSLEDYLKEQIRAHFNESDIAIAEFIVESLDEDGYLREPIFDMASGFGLSVPELELILSKVQKLDPPGIAARNLQECLLIQLRLIDEKSSDRLLAEEMLTNHWDSVSRMKLDLAAREMSVSRDAVQSALKFISKRLNPYPASMFHDPWQKLAPRGVSKMPPDVVVRKTEKGLVTEVVDPITSQLALDEMYSSLYSEMSQKKNGHSEETREHVRECVQNAKTLLEALEFRKSTLRRVADELISCQEGFFLEGAKALKPITRKQLSEKIGVHESTVSRATQDKTIRLPSGEVISFDVLFDAALPIKEMVKQLAAERLSDGEIAKRLAEAGIQVARRTVAKYREQLRVLPVEYRLAN